MNRAESRREARMNKYFCNIIKRYDYFFLEYFLNGEIVLISKTKDEQIANTEKQRWENKND